MGIVSGISFVDVNMSNKNFGSTEFRECNFEGASLRNAKIADAKFLSCNFADVDLFGATFNLSCRQGNANTLSELNTRLFLYWFLNTFDIPPEMRTSITDVLGPAWMRRLKSMFECAGAI